MRRPPAPPTAPSPEARHDLDRTAMLLLVVLCACWGLNQVAIKVANEGISPVWQAGLRSIGSTVLLVAWCRWRGIVLTAPNGTLLPGLVAGALFAGEFVAIYWGLVHTSASRGVIFIYSAPFVVALGAHWFVPGDRLTGVKLIGLTAAFLGILVLFADGLRLPNQRELVGDLLCLAGGILWGATTVCIKATSLARIEAEKTLFYQLGVSALVLPPAALALGEEGVFAPTPLVLAALAYQVLIVAFVSYTAWFWLMRVYPASRLAAFTFLTPLFGVAFGAILLGEPIGPSLIAAATLVAVGIYLVNRAPRQSQSLTAQAGANGRTRGDR